MDEASIRLSCLHIAADMAKLTADSSSVVSRAEEYFKFVSTVTLPVPAEPVAPAAPKNDEIPF